MIFFNMIMNYHLQRKLINIRMVWVKLLPLHPSFNACLVLSMYGHEFLLRIFNIQNTPNVMLKVASIGLWCALSFSMDGMILQEIVWLYELKCIVWWVGQVDRISPYVRREGKDWSGGL